MRRIEPIQVADFYSQAHLRRPNGEKRLKVSEQLRGITRRQLQEHRSEPRSELTHHFDEFTRPINVIHQLTFMTDRLRHLGTKAESLMHLCHPAFDCILRRYRVKGSIPLNGGKSPRVLPQEIRGLRAFRVKITDPAFE